MRKVENDPVYEFVACGSHNITGAGGSQVARHRSILFRVFIWLN
jgi:hypothetical protein